jgi:hypothetical protein
MTAACLHGPRAMRQHPDAAKVPTLLDEFGVKG